MHLLLCGSESTCRGECFHALGFVIRMRRNFNWIRTLRPQGEAGTQETKARSTIYFSVGRQGPAHLRVIFARTK